MPNLILIRHAAPEIVPAIPASRWQLSPLGREQCLQMAGDLAAYKPEIIIASREAKASETASILATQLGVSWKTAKGLHEHQRSNVSFSTRQEFQNHVSELFQRPDELVFGEESAHQAQARFSEAVSAILKPHDTKNIAIVAHGTVMTLWLAQYYSFDLFSFWRSMPIPAWYVLSYPEYAWIAPGHHPGEINA